MSKQKAAADHCRGSENRCLKNDYNVKVGERDEATYLSKKVSAKLAWVKLKNENRRVQYFNCGSLTSGKMQPPSCRCSTLQKGQPKKKMVLVVVWSLIKNNSHCICGFFGIVFKNHLLEISYQTRFQTGRRHLTDNLDGSCFPITHTSLFRQTHGVRLLRHDGKA